MGKRKNIAALSRPGEPASQRLAACLQEATAHKCTHDAANGKPFIPSHLRFANPLIEYPAPGPRKRSASGRELMRYAVMSSYERFKPKVRSSTPSGPGKVPGGITRRRLLPVMRQAMCLGLALIFSHALHAKPPGSGGGGGGSTQILPTSLGLPHRCAQVDFVNHNNGALPGQLVVVAGVTCGSAMQAWFWRDGAWQALGRIPPAIEGHAAAVSDRSVVGTGAEPTFVGWMAPVDSQGTGNVDFVRTPDQWFIHALPKLPDMRWTAYPNISAQGGHIVGGNANEVEELAVRWSHNGDVWVPESLGPGAAVAASDDGTVVVGNTGLVNPDANHNAWVWLAHPGGGGERTSFAQGTAVSDVSPDGTMLVGFRWGACPAPCEKMPVPIAITFSNGAWSQRDLQALDGMDSQAHGVGMVNGKPIIVGHGFTRKDAVMRAVAWVPDAQGNYDAPLRLAAIDGRAKSGAFARDVNAQGIVVGISDASGSTSHAVLWTLP